MNILARLLVTSTLALSAAVGTASAPAAAVTVTATQSSPWRIDTYVRNGQPVGSIEHYCDGPEVINGDTTTYDYIHYAYFSMCP